MLSSCLSDRLSWHQPKKKTNVNRNTHFLSFWVEKKSHLVDNLLSYCGFSVFEGLDCVVCLFHVERLLHEVISLALIPGRCNDELS